ncbi:Vegetative incompatibility protein HET-E-1 [Ceratobasidium sp. AG-Ba]|nr:Vegetative incompatibility protein HET-E-1 [Ceratobasidium sp. AG-Ba]
MLQSLKFNIFNLDPWDAQLTKLPLVRKGFNGPIASDVLYACKYWLDHIYAIEPHVEPEITTSVLDFLHHRALFWIEVLYLISDADGDLLLVANKLQSYLQEWLLSTTDKELIEDLQIFAKNLRSSSVRSLQAIYKTVPSQLGSRQTIWSFYEHLFRIEQGHPQSQSQSQLQSTRDAPMALSDNMASNAAALWAAGSMVWSVAVSPNGMRAVSSHIGGVSLWDINTGEKIFSSSQGHNGLVTCVAFSPDACMVASGSIDKDVCVWSAQTGHLIAGPIRGPTNWVCSVGFTQDNTRVIYGCANGSIYFWDIHASQLIIMLPPKPKDNLALFTLCPDNRIIATGSLEGAVRFLDTHTRLIFPDLPRYNTAICSLSLSPNYERLAVGHNNLFDIWDVRAGTLVVRDIAGHSGDVVSLAFSPNGKHIASGSLDNNIQIWDAYTGDLCAGPLRGHAGPVYSIAFMPDGNIISGSWDCTIRIWNIEYILKSEGNIFEKYDDLGSAPSYIQTPALVPKSDLKITSRMNIEAVISSLTAHGCRNLTEQLDLAACGDYPISNGGLGDIYRGKLRNGVEIAIKLTRVYVGADDRNEKQLKRVAHELYTWSKCNHPNIQQLQGLVQFRGQIGMVSEWEVHGDLSNYLAAHPNGDRCHICAQVSSGISYLHHAGVVHGDLKGANVLIGRYGVPRLVDFGSATLEEYTLGFSTSTTKATFSLRWAAPEVMQGQTKASAMADIYALGMTILEIITGKVPFFDKGDTAVMCIVLFEKSHPTRPDKSISKNSENGERLWTLLERCWLFEPEQRPRAEEVKAVMEKMTQDTLQPR